MFWTDSSTFNVAVGFTFGYPIQNSLNMNEKKQTLKDIKIYKLFPAG